MRLCKVLCEMSEGSVEMEADRGAEYVALDISGGLAFADFRRVHLDADGAEELARHLSAWAARRRKARAG